MNLRYLEPVFFTYLPFAKGDAEGFQIPLSPPFIKVGDDSNLIANTITMIEGNFGYTALTMADKLSLQQFRYDGINVSTVCFALELGDELGHDLAFIGRTARPRLFDDALGGGKDFIAARLLR
jgi:hypothetical protein